LKGFVFGLLATSVDCTFSTFLGFATCTVVFFVVCLVELAVLRVVFFGALITTAFASLVSGAGKELRTRLDSSLAGG